MEVNHPAFLPRLVPHIFSIKRSTSKKTMSRRSRSLTSWLPFPLLIRRTFQIAPLSSRSPPTPPSSSLRDAWPISSGATRIFLPGYSSNLTKWHHPLPHRRSPPLRAPIQKEMKKFWPASSILSSTATPSPPTKSCWTFTQKVHTTTTRKCRDCHCPHRWHRDDLHLLFLGVFGGVSPSWWVSFPLIINDDQVLTSTLLN